MATHGGWLCGAVLCWLRNRENPKQRLRQPSRSSARQSGYGGSLFRRETEESVKDHSRARPQGDGWPEAVKAEAADVCACLRIVQEFAHYFHRPPDQLGPNQIREYVAHLFRDQKRSTSCRSVRTGTSVPGDRFGPMRISPLRRGNARQQERHFAKDRCRLVASWHRRVRGRAPGLPHAACSSGIQPGVEGE